VKTVSTDFSVKEQSPNWFGLGSTVDEITESLGKIEHMASVRLAYETERAKQETGQ
jgi:hypothetical protein